MTDEEQCDNPTEASLWGLPGRDEETLSLGRDPVETLASQFLDEARAGKQPSMEAYIAAHPKLADEIRELFPLIAALEDWKADCEVRSVQQPLPDELDIERLGNCRLVREIGRGGMGVVFEAEQDPIGRRVAVKLLPWRMQGNSLLRDRFHREARITAQLKHPNIVPVFSFGEQDGYCFYVMQLVEGIGLNRLVERFQAGEQVVAASQIDRAFSAPTTGPQELVRPASFEGSTGRFIRRESWPQLIKMVLQVAGGLRYAHKQGTLHRDIKPANLLLDARGAVWITDFGVAIDNDPALAGANIRPAGTLRYMAPEQLGGQVDQRSDIYSLGMTLYELCTLKPPFEASSREEMLRLVVEAQPLRPRKVLSTIPRELESVIQRAIAKSPDDRYQRVDEMIAALLPLISKNSSDGFFSRFRRRWMS